MSFFRTRLSRVGMTRRSANTLLLLCTMFWGMSYALNKITSETLSPLEVMAIRYMLAGLICVFLFRRRLRRVDRQTLRDGTILALIAFVSITSIFYGLQVTEATTAAFLMSTSIIFVPLIQTVRLHRLPEPVILLCTALATAGIALLSLRDGLHFSPGALLCLCGGFLYAVAIILTGTYSHRGDGILLGVIQQVIIGILSVISMLALTDPVLPVRASDWAALLCLTLFCSAFAFTAQPYAQAYSTPENTALIFSLEPVFGAVYAFFLLGERLTPQGLCGTALVLLSVLIVSTHKTRK